MKPARLARLLMLLTCTALPASAFDISAMSKSDEEAFGAAVHAYLLAHPEVLVEVSQELQNRDAQVQAKNDVALIKTNDDDLFKDGASFVGGNPNGNLTVVEFIDYRCGYCRKAHSEVSELIKSDGNIRYVVKEFPILGEDSVVASRFAIAALRVAGPAAYAKVNAGFYESFRGEVTPANLAAFATSLGLDPAPIMAEMNSAEVTGIINDNRQLGERMQIAGTPAFVMGHQMVRGYVPLDAMRQIVTEERG